MQAMIFAAGLGTRLRPLTDDRPKALVEINGKTLLELAITKLKQSGFSDIVVNVHHFADKIEDFLQQNNNFGINISISNESSMLLDTGGGLKKASWFFNKEPFVVYNVDVITTLDLVKLLNYHKESKALATLAVRNRSTSRYLLFDHDLQLSGWKNNKIGETKVFKNIENDLIPLAFSGIHVIDPQIFEYIDSEGAFSIIDCYLSLSLKHKIVGFSHDDTIWMDLGKKENLEEASKIIRDFY